MCQRKQMRLLFSGATVHGFPVISTVQPSRFGTQVIHGSVDNKKKVVFYPGTGTGTGHMYVCL